MSKDGTNRLEAFLRTPEGERFLAQSEADAARKEAAVQQRRDIAAERDEFLRRRREVLPAMRQAVEAAEGDLAAARKAMAAAQARRSDAGHAEFSEDFAISEGVRRAEIALTRTADPRLHTAVEEADEVLRTWSETYKNLHRFRSEKTSSWDGVETWVKRFGSNEAGVDALKKGVEDAREALRKLMLVPEPGDEAAQTSIANLHAAIEATHGDPPPLVLQQFDSNGKPVGKPVEMPVVR